MRITVDHITSYSYSEPIKHSAQIIRLYPFNNSHQKVIKWSIVTNCGNQHNYADWFNNNSIELSICNKITRIEIRAVGIVETNGSISNHELGCIPLEYYLTSTSYVNYNIELNDFIVKNTINIDSDNITNEIIQLSAKILQEVPYVSGITNSATTATDAFGLKVGVCQDHTHIMLAIVRKLGFPARYVSGYLHTPDTSHVASHAWAEIWYDNAWHSFDVSNQCHAGEHHIILAYGLDYNDASPVRGSRIGGGDELLETHALVSNQ